MRPNPLAIVLLSGLLGAACSSGVRSEPSGDPANDALDSRPITIFLARHAEAVYPSPEADPRNPRLNAMGQDRADALARLLSSAGIERILSSDYHRTRETAAPLAAALGLEVELYDPSDLPSVAANLLTAPGVTFVAGHSNTTPELVGLLGGEPGEPIDESSEFDRLYILTGSRNAGFETTVLRYGDPTPEDWKNLASERRPED